MWEFSPIEHPLSENLKELSDEELYEKIAKLNSYISYCLSLGKHTHVYQMDLLIESVRSEQRLRAMQKVTERRGIPNNGEG